MKKLITTFCLLAAGGFTLGATVGASAPVQQHVTDSENVYFNTVKGNNLERSVNFDDNWRFNLGDLNNAHQKSFDDSKWESVDLPHDYSINQDYTNSVDGESGYKPGGVGWYRKTFNIDDTFTKDHSIRLDFDGVYMDSTVYLNGERLGAHPYGYTPFSFDITSKVKRNSENVLAVKVNHETPSSRWYSGSGIYRSVHLTITNDIHVDLHGSKFDVLNLKDSTQNVTIKGSTKVKNNYATNKSVAIKYELHEKTEKGLVKVAESEKSNVANINMLSTSTLKIDNFSVPRNKIKLWSVDNPNMYVIRTLVMENEQVLDTYDVDYGFRYTDWTPNGGFSLNGQKMKLQGVCMHHDQGALGAVANKDAQERQIKILKDMGVNTIRVTHNPASQTLIDLANEHGMMLIEEVFDGWHRAKNSNHKDYSRFFDVPVGSDNNLVGATRDMKWHEFDLRATVERGYNAPSIIMWSLGNEVQEGASNLDKSYVENHAKLVNILKTIDTNRYVTTGDNKLKADNQFSIQIANKNVSSGGAAGFNYASGAKYDQYHNQNPTWLMYGAETSSAINSRGVYYKRDGGTSNMELTSYDTSRVGWGALSSESWFEIIKRDFMAGEFVWTGFDYLGEPTPWNQTSPSSSTSFPRPKSSFFGIVDTAGMPKDRYYFYQSQWAPEKNTLHVLPTWDRNNINLDGAGNALVNVYSSASKVKLELFNTQGESVWTQEQTMTKFKSNTGLYEYKARNNGQNHTDLYYEFNVPYQEGKLVATAYNENGEVIKETSGRSFVETSGNATKLKATVNKTSITADKDSLAYIQVDVVDSKGTIVSKADNLIKTTVTGNGRYLVMDNGKQADMTHYTNTSRQAYNGSVVAIVGGNGTSGKMTVTFEAEGLESTSVEINVTPSENVITEPQGIQMSRYYYVYTGTTPVLPTEVKLITANGKTELKPVKWTHNTDYNTAGTYTVDGLVDGKYNTSIIVNVIDGLGGVYNQSIRTEKGKVPTLPTSLAAYDTHGNKLNFNLEVKWEYPNKEYFNRFGDVVVNGKAEFLGQTVNVTANVSIREGEITVSNVSISNQALTIKDNHNTTNELMRSLADGNKALTTDLLKNTWTNYNAVNNGSTKSEIVFEYATQTTLGRFNISYVNKVGYMEAPKQNTTKIYVSESGAEGSWVLVDYEEIIGATNNDVVEYTYNIVPTIGTFIKFEYNYSNTFGTKPYMGITELEINTGVTSYNESSTASLSELVVNGVTYNEKDLNNKTINVAGDKADISYKAKDNASVTVLPQNENIIKVVVISEDKTNETIYNIVLNSNVETRLSIVSAPKAQNNLGPEKLVDGNENTPNHYHTAWNTDLKLSAKNTKSIIIDSGLGNKMITGFKYLPRYINGQAGNTNGRVNEFRLYVSTENGNWGKAVYTGKFTNEDGWKEVKFNPTMGRFVRFEVLSSYGDSGQQNKYIAGKEIKLVMNTTIDQNAQVNIFKIGDKLDENTLVSLNVNGAILNKDYDFDITYGDIINNKVNVTIKAKGIWKGTITKEVDLATSNIVKVELLNNPYMFYSIGDIIDSKDLKARLTNDNGGTIIVTNRFNSNLFKFDNLLFDNYLSLGEKTTKVNVLGNEFTLTLNVTNNRITNNHNEFINDYTLSDNNLLGYTSTSINVYKNSLQTLNDLVVKGESLDKIYQAKKDVLANINALTLVGDTSDLEAKLNETIDKSLYTSESYNNYMNVYYSIKEKLLNKNSLSKDDINALSNELNKAKEGLTLLGTTNTPEVPNNNITETSNNVGYIIALSVGIPLSLALGIGLTLLVKSKKNI